MLNIDHLSKEERDELLAHLLTDHMDWPLPRQVFYALAPKILSVAVELAVYNDSGHILLVPRPEDDPEFAAGALHMPGTLVRPDDTLEEAIDRLLTSEVGDNVSEVSSLGYLHVPRHLAPTRPAIALLHVARLTGTYVGSGAFYDPANLPEHTLRHHRAMIATIEQRVRAREVH